MTYTAEQKSAAARRETSMRINFYPQLIRKGRLSAQEADYQIEIMREIADDYDKVWLPSPPTSATAARPSNARKCLMTIIEKLRTLESLPVGSQWPDFLGGIGFHSNWGPPLSAISGEAANEIERLQARIKTLEHMVAMLSGPPIGME